MTFCITDFGCIKRTFLSKPLIHLYWLLVWLRVSLNRGSKLFLKNPIHNGGSYPLTGEISLLTGSAIDDLGESEDCGRLEPVEAAWELDGWGVVAQSSQLNSASILCN